MKTSVEAISEVELKIEVEIAADAVDREYDRQLRQFGKRARIKGFRPGKAPQALIAKQFGGDIANETTRTLIGRTLDEVVSGLERQALGEPSVEPGIAKQGEPLKYAVRVQVKPIIDIHSWKGIEVEVPARAIDEDTVAARLKQMQRKQAERVSVEDRGADTGDVVLANLIGYLEGERETMLDAEEIEIPIGAGRMIPGFEDQLLGVRVGENAEITATFPEEYGEPRLAGKEARWEAEILQVQTEDVPDLDDELAQDLGFDDLEALRKDIRDGLQAEIDEERRRDIEGKVVSILLERNQFEVPPVMQRAYTQDQANMTVRMLLMQGADRDTAIQIVNKNIDSIGQIALQRVRRELALEALAKQEDLEADDDALSAAIVERIDKDGERVAKLYEKEEMRETLRMDLSQRRALDALIESARVVEVAPKEDFAAGAAEEAEAQ